MSVSVRVVTSAVVAVTTAAMVMVVGWLLTPWHAAAAPGEAESSFVAITPCRAVDLRPAPNQVGADGRNTPLGPGETIDLQLTGSVGNCEIPTGATALSVNLSAVAGTDKSFLTAWPTGDTPPLASVLNWDADTATAGNEIRVTLSDDGRASVRNNAGSVFVVLDVAGYYVPTVSDLQAQVAAMQDQIDALTALLDGVTRDNDDNGHDTIRFTGVNVQVVDGSGSTHGTASGLGNLILGYNTVGDEVRDGAHNLVIGDDHSYSGTGGIVAGDANTTDGTGSSVLGGEDNTATGPFSTVTGGFTNTATGWYATVLGGQTNTANGESSPVAGGSANTTAEFAQYAAILGGESNSVTNVGSTVFGGRLNTATGQWSAVAGGRSNTAAGQASVVVGGGIAGNSGAGNTATAGTSVVVGGHDNQTLGEYSVVVGGESNTTAPLGDGDVNAGGSNTPCPGVGMYRFCTP